MAELKFTGVKYDYNNISINIVEGDISVSALASSGITLGSASDYDRIAGLAPTVAKINDGVSSVQAIACPLVGASAITMSASSKTYTLTKDDNKLNCKVTS